MRGGVASIGDGLFGRHLLKGVECPVLLAEAEADGLQEGPEFVGFPLGVVDPCGSFVVHGHEVISRITGDPPGV